VTQSDRRPAQDLTVNTSTLHREDVFTDLQVATLRRLTPVREDGADDPSRPVVFLASTQLMSQMGPLPVTAELQAKTLREAIAEFPGAIREAIERMVEEAREMQRRETSQIVVPGPGAIPPAGGKGPLSLR
jgi:hypothetical protein